MNGRQTNFGIRITADGRVAVTEAQQVARSFDEVGKSAKTAAAQAQSAYDIFGMQRPVPMAGQIRDIEQSSKQAAFAMRMLPAQMTDIAVGLASGQSPFMVLMQQGGQLKDMFGGVGPAMRAVGGYVAGLVNPFTLAAAAAAALGYAITRLTGQAEKPILEFKTALSDVSSATASFARATDAFSADSLIREFNKADAQTRRNIVTLKEYQVELARTSFEELRRSAEKDLAPLADFSGFFGGEQQKAVERFFGTFKTNEQRDQWQRLQREIQAGTVDLGGFTQTYGMLFAGGSKEARDFIVQFEKIGTEAARLKQAEELLRKMRGARPGEQLPIEGAARKVDNGIDDYAREQARQYEDLYKAGARYAEGVDQQFEAGRKLTQGEQILAAAKAHLTEAQYREVEAVLSGAIAREKRLRLDEEESKRAQARLSAQFASLDGADAEIRKLREHNEEIGLSAEQLDALRLARMDDVIAIRERQLALEESTSADASYIETLRIQLEQLRQMRELTAAGQDKQRTVQESVDMWRSIERAGHDAFNSIGRDGGSVLDGLKRSLKTGLLDLLYQMTAKRWIINLSTAISGEGVASQALGSSSGLLGKLVDKVLVDQFGIGGFSIDELGAANAGFYDNATGGVYNSPSLRAYVNSVVTEPTLFNFANGAAIGRMGEEVGSPGEAILPLMRLSGGDLGVKASVPESAPQIVMHNTWQIDARGADVGVDTKIRAAVAESESRMMARISSDLGRGGSLAYATGRRR